MSRAYLFVTVVFLPFLFPEPACSQEAPAPPIITLEQELRVEPGAFLAIRPKTVGTIVRFKADAGLSVFPSSMLRDPKTTVVTGSRAGRFRLWAWTAENDVPSELAETWVTVGEPGPPPPPPPDDDPTPDPLPDKYGLAKVAHAEGSRLSVDAKAYLLPVAGAYRNVASQIAAGVIRDVQSAAVAAGQATNDAVPTAQRAAWEPLRKALRDKFSSLDATGIIKTVEQTREAFIEVAIGLERVR